MIDEISTPRRTMRCVSIATQFRRRCGHTTVQSTAYTHKYTKHFQKETDAEWRRATNFCDFRRWQLHRWNDAPQKLLNQCVSKINWIFCFTSSSSSWTSFIYLFIYHTCILSSSPCEIRLMWDVFSIIIIYQQWPLKKKRQRENIFI